MTTRKRYLLFGGALSSFFLFVITACNTQPQGMEISQEGDEDRYHEKSFSWDAKIPLAKGDAGAAIGAKETRFNSAAELAQAIQGLEEKLDDSRFTDSLWKPVDYSCGELELAVWNTYGSVFLNDALVFNESILKSGCAPTETAGEGTEALDPDSSLGKASGWTWWSQSEVSDRQYPYKMIGRSWNNFNLAVYKSTGGETQFEKNRSKFGVTAWYDTDATRIGVRVYLFDCGTDAYGRFCSYNTSKANSNSNDDYASERDIATGQIRISNQSVSIRPVALKISDAAYSMHSVDHAGLQFRAASSSGITSTTVTEAYIYPSYVTW
jgi:hypothetical protein